MKEFFNYLTDDYDPEADYASPLTKIRDSKTAKEVLSLIKTEKDFREAFGKIFFGELKRENEKNTPIEDYFEYVMNIWVRHNDLKFPSSFFNIFQKFRNVFPQDLIPESKVLYRGINMENIVMSEYGVDEKMRKNVMKIFRDPSKFKIEGNTAVKKFRYTPKRELESWTISEEIALEFSGAIAGASVNIDNAFRVYNGDTIKKFTTDKSHLPNAGERLWKMFHQSYGRWDELQQLVKEYPILTPTGKASMPLFKKYFKALINRDKKSYQSAMVDLFLKRGIPIIIEIDYTPDDFVFSSELLNRYSLESVGKEEYESLRVGKKPFDCKLRVPSVLIDVLKGKLPKEFFEVQTMINFNLSGDAVAKGDRQT